MAYIQVFNLFWVDVCAWCKIVVLFHCFAHSCSAFPPLPIGHTVLSPSFHSGWGMYTITKSLSMCYCVVHRTIIAIEKNTARKERWGMLRYCSFKCDSPVFKWGGDIWSSSWKKTYWVTVLWFCEGNWASELVLTGIFQLSVIMCQKFLSSYFKI